MVPMSQKETLQKLYTETVKDQVYYKQTVDSAKISLKHGRHYAPKRVYTFPFMDIFFYYLNDTHLYAPSQLHPLPREELFPLALRPLNRKLYFAPRDPHSYVLRNGLSTDNCYTGPYNLSYNHTRIITQKRDISTVPCRSLKKQFSFVKHRKSPDGKWCEETLMLRGKVLNTFNRTKEGFSKC